MLPTLSSKHFVSITIIGSFCSQIILQKSPREFGNGPIAKQNNDHDHYCDISSNCFDKQYSDVCGQMFVSCTYLELLCMHSVFRIPVEIGRISKSLEHYQNCKSLNMNIIVDKQLTLKKLAFM